jgi:hypothetical protein
MKIKENQARLESNGTHQLLTYVGDAYLLADNTDTTNRNTETLLGTNKEK